MIAQVAAALLTAVMIADGGAEGIKAEIHPREPVIAAQEVTEEAPEKETPEEGKHLWGVCTITHYCNCSACCGQWAGGGTASGTVPTAGRTVACELPFGTEIEINGERYTVEDRGVSGFWVDIYVNDHAEALQRGMYSAEVYIID